MTEQLFSAHKAIETLVSGAMNYGLPQDQGLDRWTPLRLELGHNKNVINMFKVIKGNFKMFSLNPDVR